MTEPDLTMLALGTDLTGLGLNLNSPDPLYKVRLGRGLLFEHDSYGWTLVGQCGVSPGKNVGSGREEGGGTLILRCWAQTGQH
jgi:hypothetical protein